MITLSGEELSALVGAILIAGGLSLIGGIWVLRRMAAERRVYWFLGRLLIGFGILGLGYVLCWLPGVAVLYYMGLLP